MDKITKHGQVCKELNELYARKNKDYGDSFGRTYKDFGLMSAVTRMSDKWERIRKISKTGEVEVKEESFRDSLIDLANYAIMTVMEMDGE